MPDYGKEKKKKARREKKNKVVSTAGANTNAEWSQAGAEQKNYIWDTKN